MNIVFESENLYFIKVNELFINDYLKMVNNYDIQKFITRNIKKYTYEELNWIKKRIDNNDLVFTMFDKKTNKFIGNIEVRYMNNGYGELGIAITEGMQNKHYGRETLKRIIEYGLMN